MRKTDRTAPTTIIVSEAKQSSFAAASWIASSLCSWQWRQSKKDYIPWLPSQRHSVGRPSDDVWSVVRDFGAVHTRLAPDFVTDARIDGDTRIVTFANGIVAREQLVDCDEARRRLFYAISSGSVQVLSDGDTRSRLIWIVDILPNEIAPYVDVQMDLGALAVQKALRRSAA